MARNAVRVEIWSGADVLGVTLSEPPVGIVAPALQYTAVQDRAGVGCSGIDRYSGPASPKVDRDEVGSHLVSTVSHGGCVPDPEVPVDIVAPALHAAIVQYSAAVV